MLDCLADIRASDQFMFAVRRQKGRLVTLEAWDMMPSNPYEIGDR